MFFVVRCFSCVVCSLSFVVWCMLYVERWQLVVRCVLFVVCFLPVVEFCSLVVVFVCWLVVVVRWRRCCGLLTVVVVRCALCVVCYLLLVVCCLLLVVCCA